MPTYSTSLKLTLIGDGEETGTWGQTTNTNLGTLLEQAIVGQTTITMANADYTLTDLNGVTDEARNAVIIITGSQNATYSVIVPAVPKLYMVTNSLASSYIAYIKPSGGSAFQIPNGQTMYLYCTGTAFVALNYVQNAQNLITGGTITTGAISCTSLTSSGGVSGTTITASSQFSGPGTGLAGTAASLSIGGTALNITATSNTSLTSLSSLNTVGTITSGTWSGSFGAVSGANLTNITGANVTGTVANATNAVNATNATNSTNATNATTAITVSTTVASGATGTTQSPGTNNTTIATTAFVQAATTALSLGTMSTQNANNVAITGGTINGVSGTNASMTVGNATNATNSTNATLATTATTANALNTSNAYQGTTFTATTQFSGPGTGLTGTAASLTAGIATEARSINNGGGWSVLPNGPKLYFNYNGTNVGSLDSSGNFIVTGNVTAYGTP
jgi:hypothetical protein